ncbi:DNA-binding protein [Sphingobium phenoxybenzoativorans]|uniref:DNA-binding protein n=1 Tax=Sphingobium phenoxybenzoativorans TaxID=1592790 RepID=A0A975Q1B5_9SPHN|nr:DNA-binding protein [Sphingobium phenoxybenzoativorans]QUT05203.1 DNA-binding protein [Sphingobium phenoxybenzoativorans]
MDDQVHSEAAPATADGGVELVKVRVLPDGRVDRRNAAAALNRRPKTLAEWQSKGFGPRPFLVGGRVFYKWAEVQAFARGEAA